MLDTASQRIIDYVQLGGVGQLPGLDTYEDINQDLTNADKLITGYRSGPPMLSRSPILCLWASITKLLLQRHITLVPAELSGINSLAEILGWLISFIKPTHHFCRSKLDILPTSVYTNNFTWSANDPLVHYTVSDLADLTQFGLNTNNLWTNTLAGTPSATGTNSVPFNTLMAGQLKINNHRYQPWNVSIGLNVRDRTILGNQLAYQDPLIGTSSDWQVPAYKFPTIGWMGRVHRGTPWQTVYLKSTPMNTASDVTNMVSIANYANHVSATNFYTNHLSWATWSGDNICWPGSTNGADAAIMEPTNDWKIMDLFSTAPNENASRGQLSINQPGVAAWMAVLDGVIAVTNVATPKPAFVGFPIDPVTNYAALTNIVASINNQRATYPNGVFTSVGDVLSTPQLTVASPFLNLNNSGVLNDAAYEYLPQQILSLLRVGSPRYVIYAYGQSLKPADHSIAQSSGYFGMCTNYQITGEVVTRTVVRFEPTDPAVLGFPPAYTNGSGAFPTMRPVIESFAVLPPE